MRGGDAASALAPTPGVGDLRRLAAELAGAGLRVDLDVDERACDLPAGVGLATYRIVQEALANALRHGGARTATVRLAADRRRLRVVVTDDGTGPVDPGGPPGHGLIGMRERVGVYGGSLQAGAAPGGGFRVEATIPFDEAAVL